jgi:cytochrome c-type biogenesis protein CcmF
LAGYSIWHMAIVGAFAASILSTLLYFAADAHGSSGERRGTAKTARMAFACGLVLLAVATLALLAAFLGHDFSLSYVYGYSSRSLSTGYLVSGLWAGQEGTYLLWALLSAAIGVALAVSSGKPGRLGESSVMKFYVLAHTLLLVLLLAASPFKKLSFTPADGAGLNPLLQDPWMVIHPPIVFVGYALYAVPFALAMAALARDDYKVWVVQALPWMVAAWLFLGAGILIGAKWAYGTLGWGGYWGWDPVENASLVPWLTGGALMHTLIMQRERGKMVRTNVVLATVSFLLVMYATFLTRSGVLTDFSVHSFSDLGMTGILVVVMAVLALVALYLIALRWGSMTKNRGYAETYERVASRDFTFFITATLFAASAAVTLLGTSAPLLTGWTGNPSSVAPSFYNITNAPLGFLLALVMAICPYLAWAGGSVREAAKALVPATVFALVATVVAVIMGASGIWFQLFLFASFMALAGNAIALAKRFRGGIRRMGGWMAHVGVALIFLGIVATSAYSTTVRVELSVGQEREVFGWSVKYVAREELKGIDAMGTPIGWRLAVSKATDGGGSESVRWAVPYVQPTRQGMLRHPAIVSTLSRDLYIAPLEERGVRGGTGMGAGGGVSVGSHAHQFTLAKGQSVEDAGLRFEFVGFDMSQHMGEDIMVVGATLKLSDPVTGDELGTVTPLLGFTNTGRVQEPAYFEAPGGGLVAFSLVAIDAGAGRVQVMVSSGAEKDSDGAGTATGSDGSSGSTGGSGGSADVEEQAAQGWSTVVFEVSNKPFVSLLWIGSILLLAGAAIAVIRRAQEAQARAGVLGAKAGGNAK